MLFGENGVVKPAMGSSWLGTMKGRRPRQSGTARVGVDRAGASWWRMSEIQMRVSPAPAVVLHRWVG